MIISSFEELEVRLQEKLMELNFDISIFGEDMKDYEKFIKCVHHEMEDRSTTASKIIHSAMTELYGLTDKQFETLHQIYVQKRVLGFADYGALIPSNEENLSYFFRSKYSESVYYIDNAYYKPVMDFTEYPIVSLGCIQNCDN